MSLRTRVQARHRAPVPRSEVVGVGVGPVRRTLDILVATVLLLVASPFVAVIALLILVTDGRPVFFRQTRVGELGRPFLLYKLRTMQVVASGPEVTTQRDPRITPIGAFLRRTGIDELPQLWHVLRGQMTLVGPRPESDTLAGRYPASCQSILLARPGLTGPVQLHYRERSNVLPEGWSDIESYYLQVLVPIRVAADQEYLADPSLRRTVRYLFLTALFVTGLVDLQRTVVQTAADTSS